MSALAVLALALILAPAILFCAAELGQAARRAYRRRRRRLRALSEAEVADAQRPRAEILVLPLRRREE